MGRGHLTSDLEGLESHKLPQRGLGQSPSQKWVLVLLEAWSFKKTHLMAKKIYFCGTHLVTFTFC